MYLPEDLPTYASPHQSLFIEAFNEIFGAAVGLELICKAEAVVLNHVESGLHDAPSTFPCRHVRLRKHNLSLGSGGTTYSVHLEVSRNTESVLQGSFHVGI